MDIATVAEAQAKLFILMGINALLNRINDIAQEKMVVTSGKSVFMENLRRVLRSMPKKPDKVFVAD